MRISIAAMLTLLLVMPASGELRVCNSTGYPLTLALGYYQDGNWKSEGWWRIDGGACQVVISGDLTNRYYYYYAEHKWERGGEWSGNRDFFCISRNRFIIYGNARCEDRGYEKKGFRQIDVGTVTSWKVNLTD
jgi:uncharacterized membrane protein